MHPQEGQRSFFDKVLGRWYEPTPKAHRFVSGLGAGPDSWATALPSARTFVEAKLLKRFRAGLPWLPYGAIRYLDARVRPGMRVLEVGAGQSTVYFAQRGATVDSVERNAAWREEVSRLTAGRPVRLVEQFPADVRQQYDVVLLDDEPRELVFEAARSAVTAGGALLVDNWDWPRYDAIRARHQPTRVFTDFAPYNFSVSATALFEVSAAQD